MINSIENITIAHQQEISQLNAKIQQLRSSQSGDRELKRKYETEIEDLKQLHEMMISELKKGHINERGILENRIHSLENQIKSLINNHPPTESSFMITESLGNLEILTEEEIMQSTRSFGPTKPEPKDYSTLFENYRETEQKLENLQSKILPEKEKAIQTLEKKLLQKEIQVKNLENELGKSERNLESMKTNVVDLKQRAKVLEDYLGEQTQNQRDSLYNSSMLIHRMGDSIERKNENSYTRIAYEGPYRSGIPDYITPVKHERQKGHKTMYKSNPRFGTSAKQGHTKGVNSTKRKIRKGSCRKPLTNSMVHNLENSELVPHNLQLDLSRITVRDNKMVKQLADKKQKSVKEDEIYLKRYFRNEISQENFQESFQESFHESRQEIYQKYCGDENSYLLRSYEN